MNSKLLLFAAAILSIVSAWLPWVSMMGISANGFQGDSGNPGLFFVVLGVLIGLMAIFGKKWSAVVAILLSLCVAGLGAKYYHDATTLGASAGYGVYAMMAGGVLGIIGGAMGLKGGKSAATV